jgi:hypothetical protein
MSSITNVAGFVKANMPFSQGNTLSDQEAWDVATYLDSLERPQDPRFKDSVAETRKAHHDLPMDMYGQTVNGVLLGQKNVCRGQQFQATIVQNHSRIEWSGPMKSKMSSRSARTPHLVIRTRTGDSARKGPRGSRALYVVFVTTGLFLAFGDLYRLFPSR